MSVHNKTTLEHLEENSEKGIHVTKHSQKEINNKHGC